MSTILSASKRFISIFYLVSSFLLIPIKNPVVSSWASYWISNQSKIITLTFINTAITTGSEIISREVLSQTVTKDQNYRFFVRSNAGVANINKHSLLNILMTFFASLLAGPIFFIRRRSDRFIFFALFGSFNSILAQIFLIKLTGGIFIFSKARLLFDLIYNVTIKFTMFEWFRKPLVTTESSKVFKLFFIRGKQDILTTLFKNTVLNIFKFRG